MTMLCPFKLVDPSAQGSMACEPQCAWRAAEVVEETEDSFKVFYYCGAVSNSTRIEMVNIDGPVQIPKNQPMPAPEEDTDIEEDEGLA